jgi:hypothetical protein
MIKILISVGLLMACTATSTETKQESIYQLKVENVGEKYYRLENSEVTCYIFWEALQCKWKERR